MADKAPRIAVLFPADSQSGPETSLDQSRVAAVAEGLAAAGADPFGVPYRDDLTDQARSRLLSADAVLVWFNPVEGGQDRSNLNALLRDISKQGVYVSAHPDIIDKIGTKEVLYLTRSMSWGADTRLYSSIEAMRAGLANTLAHGARVLKQIRGQSGDGVWKVSLADKEVFPQISAESEVMVRHAKRGSSERRMSLSEFSDLCRPYYSAAGAMIDQPYQPRLTEGMVRCYIVGDKVQGFGEQQINALYPAPPGAAAADAPQPGPRLYFPPTRPDFQTLKAKLETQWIGEMDMLLDIQRSQLPVLWDADFLFGPRNAEGDDTYVLCEINVSSVFPFPPSALEPLVTEAIAKARGSR